MRWPWQKQRLDDKTALVTGASSGLGVDFARELASRGANLILVARREDLLRQLQADLAEVHEVEVMIFAMDLAVEENREQLARDIDLAGVRIDILINNAGFGLFGDFREADWDRTDQMLQLDIVALTHLTRLFVNPMVEWGEGYIVLIGSTGSFQPAPSYAVYSAAKAYVLSLGHALHYELRGTGVSCTTVCPGVTATEFLLVSGQEKTWYQKFTMMESPTVVSMAIKAMLARKPQIVTGFINALVAFSTRLTPRPLLAMLAHRLMENRHPGN